MTKTKTRKKTAFRDWSFTEDIKTKEDVIGMLEATLELAIQEDDPAFLLAAIGDIAKSEGMEQLARELNLDRSSLYRSFSSKGNPSFFTVVKVLDNLGFQLSIRQKVPA